MDLSPANPAFCGGYVVGRGLASGDLDNDGAVDLLVTAVGTPARIYRNIAPPAGRWLTVRAIDPALKRDVYGAQVTVRAAGARWTAWLNPGGSYACSNDPRLHFGLGDVKQIDAIEVIWADGAAERFDGGAPDRALTLERGMGKAAADLTDNSAK